MDQEDQKHQEDQKDHEDSIEAADQGGHDDASNDTLLDEEEDEPGDKEGKLIFWILKYWQFTKKTYFQVWGWHI